MDAQEIRSRTDIVKLIEDSGVELTGNGHTLSGICPFHEDRKPSLKVQPDKQWWWCYGCADDGRFALSGTGGDCFAWIMKRDNCDFRAAVQILGKGNLSSPIIRKPKPTRKPLSIPNLVVEEYHENLLNRPKAIKWLNENKFWSEEIIRESLIGFDPASYRFTLPIPSPVVSIWEDLRMYDPLGNHSKKMMPYISGSSALPYMFTRDNNYLLIVEGEPDALACASLGLNVATNTCGAGSVLKVWQQWYGLIFTDRIVLCFDNDEAGDHALYGIKNKRLGLTDIFPSAKVLSIPEELGNKSDATDAIRVYGGQWFKEKVEELLV